MFDNSCNECVLVCTELIAKIAKVKSQHSADRSGWDDDNNDDSDNSDDEPSG